MEPILHREAAARGLTPGVLRSARFAHPVDGVAVLVEDATVFAQRCAAALAVVGDRSVVTHLSAGILASWWLPDLRPPPVILGTSGDATHLQRRGVYVRRCDVPARHRATLHGLPSVSPEWAIAELAEDLAFVDLVVAIDSAVHRGDTTMERLWTEAVVPKRRGVRTLRKALLHADGRSESVGESLLRLAHTMSGIPVDVQPEYRDEQGELLVRLDLRVRGTRRAPEYDGADHRTPGVHRRDLRRERLLHRLGIERAGYTLPDLAHLADEIIRDSGEALGSRWAYSAAEFVRAFAESSFTDAGKRRLASRLARFDCSRSPRSVENDDRNP